MADPSLTVRFGGDTAALNASIAAAKAALASFAPGAVNQARSSMLGLAGVVASAKIGSDLLSDSLRENLRTAADASQTYLGLRAAAGDATTGFLAVGRATEAAMTAADSSLDKARTSLLDYYRNAAYAQRGTEDFAVANEGLDAAVGRAIITVQERFPAAVQEAMNRIRLLQSDMEKTQLKAIAAAGGLDAFSASLAGTDRTTAAALVDLTAQLERIPGLSDAGATSILAMLTAIPSATAASTSMLVNLLQTLAKSGDEAQAMARQWTEAFRSPDGGKVLADLVLQLQNVEGRLKAAGELARHLAPDQAVAMFERIEKSLKDEQAILKAQDDGLRRQLDTMNNQGGELDNILGSSQQQLALDKARTEELDRQRLMLEVQRQGYAGIADEVRKAAEFQKAIGAGTAQSRRDGTQETIDALKGGLSSRKGSDDIDTSMTERIMAAKLAVLEAGGEGERGMLAVLFTLKNRLNAAYGNYGDTLQQVIEKDSAFSSVNDAKGKFDASKLARVTTDSLAFRQAFALYDKVNGADTVADPTGGATHFFDDSIPDPQWARRMGNRKTIGRFTTGNPDGPAVTDSDSASQGGDALQEKNTLLREQNAAITGGNELQKLQAEQAEQNLGTARNQVAEAEAQLRVRRQMADKAGDGTEAEQAKANEAVVSAQATLLERQRAQQEAAKELEIARAADGSERKKALELDLANFRQARWAAGTAEFDAQEKAKTEIGKRYAAEAAAQATETENERYDVLKRGIAARQQAVRDEVQAGVLSGREGLAQQRAILAEQAADERQHFATLQQINAEKPAMVRRYALAAAQAQDQVNAQDAKLQEAYLRDIEMSFKQHFDQIGSTVSTDLMGMMEHTKTIKTLFADVVKSMVSQMVSGIVKMGADYAAHIAFKTSMTALGQTQETAAVTAGEAARAAAVTAGQAAASATKATAMSGSILASANETYAGVFGFLSPTMGPFAAVPAGAAAALVAAKAALPSFDVGAWSLPHDMVANVHAGEMIVPAGPAALMRAAAGGGGAGGAPAMGPVHFNINAIDTRSGLQFIQQHAGNISKTLNAHWRQNWTQHPNYGQ